MWSRSSNMLAGPDETGQPPFLVPSGLVDSRQSRAPSRDPLAVVSRDNSRNPESSRSAITRETTREQLESALSIYKSVDQIRCSLEESDQWLRSVIQQELQEMKASISAEVLTLRNEVVGHHERLHNRLGKHEENHENIQQSLDKHDTHLQDMKEAINKFSEIAEGKVHLRTGKTLAPDQWSKFMKKVDDMEGTSMYQQTIKRKCKAQSFWHEIFEQYGLLNIVFETPPTGCLAQATESLAFVSFQTVLILLNTLLMGYEADVEIKALLNDGEPPQWINVVELVFNVTFAVELCFRVLALRSWFFVAPSEWGWNLFDICLVATSFISEILAGTNLTFMRTFRILRAVRIARLIRVLRFFRKLRQILFSILGCLSSLSWAFVFMALIMFMFSILFLQGLILYLHDIKRPSEEFDLVSANIGEWFPSVGGSMLSLLASVTGGVDWLSVKAPLDHAGTMYSLAYVVYMLFVTVGVMNVLTGVFLSSAEEFSDLSLTVQNEMMRVEKFVEQIMELFEIMDMDHNGEIDWPTFMQKMMEDRVWTFFASLQLEPTHIKLLFDMLDHEGDGKLSLLDLTMGIVRLMGEAKAIDARVIQRQVSMIPSLLQNAIGLTNGHGTKQTDV